MWNIFKAVNQLTKGQQTIMDALTDLKAAVTKLQTSTSAELKAVAAAITASQSANAGAVSAADAEAIVTQINGVSASLDAETAALTPATA